MVTEVHNELFQHLGSIDRSFELLKARLVASPVLVQPEFKKEFILETDASD